MKNLKNSKTNIEDKFKKMTWIITEKVDGISISLVSDGNDVKIIETDTGKGMLDPILIEHENSMKELTEYLQKVYEVSEVQVFGKKIKLDNSFQDYLVFDILVTFKELQNNKELFLDWDSVKRLSEIFGFITVPELYSGTFEECSKFVPDKLSKLNELFSLKTKKLNAGIIIKPRKSLSFKNRQRYIYKNINENMIEEKNNKILTNYQSSIGF